MKIRNSSRITAIVLALVMLLPLISIPAFAVEADEILYSEDFTSYAGLEGDALMAKLKTNWHSMTAKNVQAVTDGDNTYMRFPTEAMMPEGSQYNVPIYVYTDGYKHWNATYTSRPQSYDPETGTLTFVDGEETFDITVDVTKKSEDGQKFGTFSYNNDGQTWIAATGYYAACNRFGDGYAVDKYSHIYFGECELYTAEDPEVLAGTKNVGDVKTTPVGISYEDHEKVVITYKAYIEPGSGGTHNMQLNVFTGEATINGETNRYSQNFVELGNLNLATGTWTGGALGGAVLPQGEWVDLYFIVDLKKGTVEGLFDGEVRGKVTASRDCNGDKVNDAMTNLTISGWTVSKIMKGDPAGFAGALCIDDVQVLPGNATSGLVKFKSYVNDFEGKNVGDTASGFSGLNAAYKIAADPEDSTNMVLALGNSNEGTGARDNSAKIQHSMISKDMTDYFILSTDYYIPTGTGNQFQVQFHPYNAVINGVVTSSNWGDVYVIRSKDGVATIGREGNPAAYTLPYDTWFTVTVEFQMSTNTYDIYVDGAAAVTGQSLAKGEALDSLNGASVIMAKQNKVADAYLKGTMYMDNIVMAAGEFEGAFGGDDVWTEDDLYADLMTFVADPDFQDEDYDPNAEVAENGVFAANNAYSFPNTLVFVDADADWTPDAIQLNIASTAVADDPETEEDETVAEGAVDKMVRPMHVGISAKKASTIVLSANYTVSEDAEGVIELQLHETAPMGWYLYGSIDCTNSTINGVAFTKGEQFNVTVVMDTVTGTIKAYYNNLLIHSATNVAMVKNGLSVAEWSVAKMMNGCETYAGNIIVDDMTITCKLAGDKAENPLYLYAQENMVAPEDIVDTVDAASIRLFAPTGLRFAAKVDASVLSNATKIGMLIAPAEYVETAGAFTKEALATLGYVTNYIDVAAEVGNYYNGNGTTADLGEGTFITASIVNILDKNLTRDFAAIAYVEIDGQIYYADTYHVACIKDIAAAALESGDYADYEAILSAYANAE